MASREPTPLDEYLAGLPEERRKAVRAVRAAIRKRLPKGYVEQFSGGYIEWVVPLDRYPKTYNRRPLQLAALASQKQYLSVYPFTKTPAWYLLPFEQRRDLMIEHGRMGNEFPSILTNTVNSFGIADQEFIVALEDDDPATLVKMVQRLRAAAVREYTAVDTPIFLGLRMDLADALRDAI